RRSPGGRMNTWKIAALFGAGILVGCMANGHPLPAQDTHPSSISAASASSGLPLILDRSDLRIGTSVYFRTVPNASEVNDLRQVRALAHVVLALDQWPADVNAVATLSQVPEE